MAAEMERAEQARISMIARVVIDVEPESYHFGEACRSAQPMARRARALAERLLERYTTLAPSDSSVDRRLGARIDLRV